MEIPLVILYNIVMIFIQIYFYEEDVNKFEKRKI